ncbi:MAG: hypothetical protein JWO06_906 [Bacteroidota bacterium]|nr:hypothetical protein [Bacteroidota bacterium]
MSRIKPLAEAERTPTIEAAFERHIKEQKSRITNMKATMGKNLIVFDVYMRWYDLYEEVKTIVGGRSAYLFCHAISEGSNCPLCTTYFRKIMIENGEKPEQLVLDDKEQALVDFGSAIANNKGEVEQGIYAAVSKLYSQEAMIVLVGFAGQMIATNIFNNVLEVEVDEYLAPYVDLNK